MVIERLLRQIMIKFFLIILLFPWLCFADDQLEFTKLVNNMQTLQGSFTQKVIEHSLMKDSTAMICSGADQTFNSDEFFSEKYKIQSPLILTRLDLCSDLPSALNSLADSGAEINGTATGPWK